MEYFIHFKRRSENSLSDDEARGIPQAFEIIVEANMNLSIDLTQKYD